MNRKALIVPVLGLSTPLLTGCVNKVSHYDGIIALDTGSHIFTVPQNATVDITKN
ncbi:hypothetical protein [Limosilactobacillus mucosae]|uniref:hypothetical protein n=1 Tax=Limosilactobacillus mucosae TaxID=97478 RepID=UPI0002E0C66D|nr:hypothetical protein [Limosilactobacillus mucosae]